MSFVTHLACLVLLAGQTAPQTVRTTGQAAEPVDIRVTPDFMDYATLPRARDVSLRTVEHLIGTRRLVDEKGQLEEHYVLDLEYVRREGALVLTRYLAVRQDGALLEYDVPARPGDLPVVDLEEVQLGTRVFYALADVDGLDLEAEVVTARETFERETRLARPGARPPADLEAWLTGRNVVMGEVVAYEARTNEDGLVVESFALELAHGGATFRLQTGPLSTDGEQARAVLCPRLSVSRCIDLCIGNCSGAACRCSFLGFCARVQYTVCGGCPVAPRTCRKQIAFLFPRLAFLVLCAC